MFKLVFVFIITLTGLPSIFAVRTVNSHLNHNDLARLQKVFTNGLASDDLQSIYYSTLNVEVKSSVERDTICEKIQVLHKDSKLNDFEKDFYFIGAHKKLNCAKKMPESLLTKVYAVFKSDLGSTQEIYYNILTHKNLGVQIDDATIAKIAKKVEDLLKVNDSLVSLGYAFNIAAKLGVPSDFVANRVGSTILMADEVDGKMLQFEGGLSITALIINGAFDVSKSNNKPVPLSPLQAEKFANYFLSRRSVQTSKGAHLLIEALKTLIAAKEVAPICLQVIGNGQLTSASPILSVSVVDLLGKPISPLPTSLYGEIKRDSSVQTEKVQFVSKSSDKTSFSANLSNLKLLRGTYNADISVDNKYTQKLNFKIMGRVVVKSLSLGVSESSAVSAAKKYDVKYPDTLAETLFADSTQKFFLNAMIIDNDTTKPITVHQSFLRLLNKVTDEEIIFVGDQDSSKTYKFDIDVGPRSADFGSKSGEYEIYLIIGDAFISNSFQWHVANIEIQFLKSITDIKQGAIRTPLPEITHEFRPPEKRPPRFVSDIFTGLSLAPLALLFIFWSKLGINISNFSLAPTTIGFHLGFGGILSLFFVFWWKLNMFQTLRLLIPIAIFTFLCGNRLLRRLYTQRVSKQNVVTAS